MSRQSRNHSQVASTKFIFPDPNFISFTSEADDEFFGAVLAGTQFLPWVGFGGDDAVTAFEFQSRRRRELRREWRIHAYAYVRVREGRLEEIIKPEPLELFHEWHYSRTSRSN